MLKFSKDNQHSNNWRTFWKASGNCETDYEITAMDGKYYVTVCQYKRFVQDTGSFAYFKDAKKWANKDNDYLAEVDAIETESEDLDFLDSLCDDGLMP